MSTVEQQIHTRVPSAVAEGYLDTIAARTVGGPAIGYAHELFENGNEAFREVVPSQLASEPVAMHREDGLETSLSQLALQQEETPAPFSVTVSANYPTTLTPSERRRIAENLDLLQDAKRSLEVPFSFFEVQYPDGTPIGTIREEQVYAGVLHYRKMVRDRNLRPADILFTNWDADTRRANSWYFGQTQKAYAVSNAVVWAARPEYVRQEKLDEWRFPRINRLIDWDFFLRATMEEDVTEQHFTYNLGALALSNGYENKEIAEHWTLWNTASHNVREGGAERVVIKGANVEVSSRRLADHVSRGLSFAYAPLTNTTQAPEGPLRDIDERTYELALCELLRSDFIPIVQRRCGRPLDQIDGMTFANVAVDTIGLFIRMSDRLDGSSRLHLLIENAIGDLLEELGLYDS